MRAHKFKASTNEHVTYLNNKCLQYLNVDVELAEVVPSPEQLDVDVPHHGLEPRILNISSNLSYSPSTNVHFWMSQIWLG